MSFLIDNWYWLLAALAIVAVYFSMARRNGEMTREFREHHPHSAGDHAPQQPKDQGRL